MAGLVVGAGTATEAAPATPARHAERVVVAPTQELVVLLRSQTALRAPDQRSSRLRRLRVRRPITGRETVLPVIGHATGPDGVEWLRVMLPGRPNGLKGWIARGGTTPAITGWHIVVRTSRRRVIVYRSGRAVRAFKVVVGKPSTPTPRGRFFVEEPVRLGAAEAGAPFALALSARSTVLQEFAGGPGQIALHGTNNIGGVPGSAVSHGCVRLRTRAIRWLAARTRSGTPVTITR